MRPVLYVGNRNYSSWSLRPWLALTWANIDFETVTLQLGGEGYGHKQVPEILRVSPTGTVPVLHAAENVIWDSLAICEWAAERAAERAGEQHTEIWPKDRSSRAVARALTAEMHAGFTAIRSNLPCNIRRRAERRELTAAVIQEITRIEHIFSAYPKASGGPYLFGRNPTIADAFFTPIATRLRTYDVEIGEAARPYLEALLANPAFKTWEAAALAETWSMPQWDAV